MNIRFKRTSLILLCRVSFGNFEIELTLSINLTILTKNSLKIIVTEIGALNKVPKDTFSCIAPFSTCNLYLL